MPETLYLRYDRPADVGRAAAILRGGGLVAFPTETVYGLGANAFSAKAVAGIFRAKGRPSWDPLIVHISGADGLTEVSITNGELEDRARRLSAAFWPGPLTLLLPRAGAVPDEVTAGRPLVGVRVPSHPAAQALLLATGLPVAAPSANRFGHISPTTAEHVLADLGGRIDAVLDGGPTPVGVESTVLDPGPTPAVIYRAGAVTAGKIRAVLGISIESFAAPAPESGSRRSMPAPGVGLRHYAPEVELILTAADPRALAAAVADLMTQEGTTAGVLLPDNWNLPAHPRVRIERWGDWEQPATLAAALFAGLRALEALAVTAIVCPLPPPGGLRDALRDRLSKAAQPR